MSISTAIGVWRPPPVVGPMFCTPFDQSLAEQGPPAVFLHDTEGLLRFDAEWTRDAWQRVDPQDRTVGPRTHTWSWRLVTDRASRFSFVVLATSSELLRFHPRLDTVEHPTRLSAIEAWFGLGVPPLRATP